MAHGEVKIAVLGDQSDTDGSVGKSALTKQISHDSELRSKLETQILVQSFWVQENSLLECPDFFGNFYVSHP